MICNQNSLLLSNHKRMILNNNLFYYISKLVRALWLVNIAGRTLLHGPLKFKVVFIAKLLRDLSPHFLNLYGQ